jgi:hypothetical protein
MKYFVQRTAIEVFTLQTILPSLLLVVGVFRNSEILLVVAGVVWAAVQSLWLVSISRESNSHLPSSLERSTQPMEAALTYAFLYVLIGPSLFLHTTSMLIVVPHLAAMAAVFYALWFSARQLSSVRDGSYSLENTFVCFLLMWFFPLGVWFLQPIVQERLGRKGA